MNLPSLYTGLAIVVLILLPFIIGAIRGRKKAKMITREFLETGHKYGIAISETETWNDRVMGLDKDSKKLLFRHTSASAGLTEKLIDLSDVLTCTTETSYLRSSESDKVIESIRLVLRNKLNRGTEVLSVYNAELDLNVYSEVQIAEKWNSKINACLN